MAEQGGASEPAAAPAAGEGSGSKAAKPPPAVVMEKVGAKPSLEDISEDEVKAFVKDYYDRWVATEGEHYDLEYAVKLRDMQIQELEIEVSDMRGKFIIPKLKKVHSFKLMGGEE